MLPKQLVVGYKDACPTVPAATVQREASYKYGFEVEFMNIRCGRGATGRSGLGAAVTVGGQPHPSGAFLLLSVQNPDGYYLVLT